MLLKKLICLMSLVFMTNTNAYSVCCKGYTISGDCIPCDDPGTGTTTPVASSKYFNNTGDVITVVNGTETVSYMGINLSKINKNHNKLIISLAGAGVWADAGKTSGPMETLLYGDQPSTSSNYGDGVYKLAANYIDKNTVAVIGYPWFGLYGGVQINDENWGPGPDQLATRIKQALDKMAPKSKLILLGKSMGACKMQQVAEKLNSMGIPINLLVLVDGSCSLADHSGVHEPIYSNVKKIYNFRQISTWPDNDSQNGFSISFSSPTIGYDIIVGDVGNSIGDLMCEGVGHNDIDDCTNLLSYIDVVIKKELKIDIMSILNLLLLN